MIMSWEIHIFRHEDCFTCEVLPINPNNRMQVDSGYVWRIKNQKQQNLISFISFRRLAEPSGDFQVRPLKGLGKCKFANAQC